MLFNSLEFLLFFPIVVFIYYKLQHKYRWVLLLVASYYFYMAWKPEYIVLIVISTLIDYTMSIRISEEKTVGRRRLFLLCSLLTNLGILFVFKYYNFFVSGLNSVLDVGRMNYSIINHNLILPMGISFYTFQTMSYTIDIYRNKRKPERHIGIFALYVTFFPQLVAGPIERSDRLIPQFYKKIYFNYDGITTGLKRMLLGFF